MHLEAHVGATLSGETLFYPTAGRDWSDFLAAFGTLVRRFVFADLGYQFTEEDLPRFPFLPGCRLVEERLRGPRESRLVWRDADGGPYRDIEPGWLTRELEDRAGQRLELVFRRGFGQYALRELEDRSVKVFVHRGDSAGEGGSNISFFRDYASNHEPCGHLLSTLARKLTRSALIITDGSNTRNFLARFHLHRSSVEADVAYEEMRGRAYRLGPLSLECVGYTTHRYGPTLIWHARQ